ncbi:T9SS type A sorting domain-containing protein [Hymenobacter negativus]|uniref:T9SS type A sorting domain-containing protein n=1 Tax=Hymenobacter negativus TaxID=2795026 RepID=A0ABS0Q3V3_9BACT|nr:T9SS type A sorting domain-containing protein [Hymenobacter negativus]MBH8557043.1 T9SS type A sorting domain-containing protein [Hymenobacter negativus]
MKAPLLFLASLSLLPAVLPHAQAQTLDPTFAPSSVFAPGAVGSVAEQPDGKLVIAGRFSRLNGSPASSLSRLTAAGTVDAAFQQNVGTTSGIYEIGLAANGKILASAGGGSVTAGGLTRPGLVRLNADGTGDATFNPGTGPAGSVVYLDEFLSLPNGQTIVVGTFDTFNGATVNNIVRLTATGAVDATFNTGTGVAGTGYTEVNTIVALPSGKYLIAGQFTSFNGNPCNGLARLNADGSFDPSFSTNLGADSYIVNVLVQPDGKILLTGSVYVGAATTGQGLARLTATGALDTGFTPPAFPDYDVYSFSGSSIQLQPDGKILLISNQGVASAGVGRVARLNTNGTVDATFQVGTGPSNVPSAITLLANGKLLVAGSFTNFNGLGDRPLVEVTSTGALDQAFQPVLQNAGIVLAMVRQADGKIVAGGNFSEINGQPMRRLARFNATGSLDATFPSPNLENSVTDLALQPDGRLLAAGPSFLKRYQTTGALDNTLTASFNSSNVKLLLQPDGRILVGSTALSINNTGGSVGIISTGFMRLLADGSIDNSFAPNGAGANRFIGFTAMTLQPNGKILVAGRFVAGAATVAIRTVMRLESTGALDASFAGAEFTGALPTVNTLTVQPDGKVLAGGSFTGYSNTARSNVARLNADGTLDTGFVPPVINGIVNKLLVQPNNRILVAGSINGTGLPSYLTRLLSTGTADNSFGASAVPNSSVNALLIQPDGAIVIGGSFTAIAGQTYMGLARLTASNVLHVQAPQAVAARTQAWPVPAHTALTVAPDASAHPQALDLLDALGRAVRHLELNGAAPASLALDNLPAGTYLLRVTYAEGAVTRRVQVQ